VDPLGGIFLVVDGVGGHVAGEVAADLAVKTILARLGRSIGSPEERVRQAITLANNEIFRQATEVPAQAGMACVVTLALLADDRLTIGHVGDSRMYKLTPDEISKLTHDHSPIGQREDAQELSELEAMRHPRRNEVFRDVGSAPHEPDDVDFIELVTSGFEDESAILLCSDGLSDMLTATEIQRVVRLHAGDPGAVVDALVTAANAAGGKDNVTVVYAEGPKFPRVRAAADETLPLPIPSVASTERAHETPRGFFRRLIEGWRT
jgi:serine/threonine protein phosphatase PrpC